MRRERQRHLPKTVDTAEAYRRLNGDAELEENKERNTNAERAVHTCSEIVSGQVASLVKRNTAQPNNRRPSSPATQYPRIDRNKLNGRRVAGGPTFTPLMSTRTISSRNI